MRSSERRSVYRKGLPELAGDAQQLVAVFSADPQRHRHWDDATKHRAPEGIDERFVLAQKQDQVIAALRAEFLQVVQDAECAGVQIGEGDAALVLLTLEVGDAAGDLAIAFDQFGECGGSGHQRRSSLMTNGLRVRRLICASSSIGSSEASVSR